MGEKELEAEEDNLREEAASASPEDKSSLMKGLMEVMEKMKDLEKNGASAPPQQPPVNEKVEAAVRAFGQNMQKGESYEAPGSNDEQLQACTLMAVRRFSNERKLFQRLVADESPLTPGEASKEVVFKVIASCLKKLSKEHLEDFRASGGFAIDSGLWRHLSDDMVNEAENKKSSITLQGDVFRLGFDKARWAQMKRHVAKHLEHLQLETGSGEHVEL